MPDSGSATIFDDLPESLVVDKILVRLPAKDVLRCRAVCKSWRSGTSTDKFILDHHRTQPSLPVIIHRQNVTGYSLPDIISACTGASSDKKMRPFVRCTGFRIRVIDAVCDGLFILSRRNDFYICNPATRRSADLPLPPLEPWHIVDVVGFYRHHTSGEYRVLWSVYSYKDLFNFDHWPTRIYPTYFVLAVGSHQPRLIHWPAVSNRPFPHIRSSYHRGRLHWAIGLDITVFDTVTETFRQMSRPAQLGNSVSLLDMGGALGLCGTTRVTVDVWVLQDYDAETWGFQYRINLLAMVASPPLDFGLKIRMNAVINERELLILMGRERLLHCDIDGVFLGNMEIEDHVEYLALTRHRLQESMISIPLFETQEEDAVNREPPFFIVL